MPSISVEIIKLYRSLFNTRDDVFALYWEDLPGKKSGYAPVYRLNQDPQALSDAVILSHLEGNQIIGVYPLFPDNTTAFLAIDFDGSDWFNLIQKVAVIAVNNGLFSTIERSKTGKKLEKQGIAPILRNVFYTGKIKFKGEIYQGNHEPIIDEKTFLLCG